MIVIQVTILQMQNTTIILVEQEIYKIPDSSQSIKKIPTHPI